MTNLSKGSTYSAVVPLTAIGFSKLTNLVIGNTYYLNLNLNLVSYDVPDVNLVFQ